MTNLKKAILEGIPKDLPRRKKLNPKFLLLLLQVIGVSHQTDLKKLLKHF